MRTLIDHDPFLKLDQGRQWHQRGTWPGHWVRLADDCPPPFVAAYRCRFTAKQESVARLHVTADERYDIFLDGIRIGRGSERGDPANWFFESYDLALPAGPHVLVARVWSLGKEAPYAQMSVGHGFLCAAEGELSSVLTTGTAAWEATRLTGYLFTGAGAAWGAGSNLEIHGNQFPWGFELGAGCDWAPAVVLHPGMNGAIKNEFSPAHQLWPAKLPAMLEQEIKTGLARHIQSVPSSDTDKIPVLASEHLTGESAAWTQVLAGVPLVIPAGTLRRVILDLQDYYCAYPVVTVSGGSGAALHLRWAEALFEPGTGNLSAGGTAGARTKGNRDQIEGKYFLGVGDVFRPDGGDHRAFETLWWHAGRYVEIIVQTAAVPLTIEGLAFRETRYPLRMESSLHCDDPRWEQLTPIALRALQMCSHETYMDCPYYEQLMYVGDTRLQVLTTYALTHDDRLPRKALQMFAASRLISRGLMQSRYPSRVTQIIPPFSLWWVAMVHDHALWRGDSAFVRTLMPGVRSVLDTFLGWRNTAGLVHAPPGWNFMDWVPEWTATTNDVRNWGVPPDGEFGVNALINWQTVLTLQQIAELEEWLSEPELATRARRRARELAAASMRTFWQPQRNLFADDSGGHHFSEHTQCLALLSGCLEPAVAANVAAALVADPALARTTIYFAHYLFETLRQTGPINVLFDRMQLWFGLAAQGFKTTFEEPEPTRSDCHGWGAHPLYHYFATVLGIRPSQMGFTRVRIQPQLGPLQTAHGALVHPQGLIRVEFTRRGNQLAGSIELPAGLTGEFIHGQTTQQLHPGRQSI